MRIGLYGAALGAIQQEKQMTVIANNLANVGTPGYKKDSIHFSHFIAQDTYTRMDNGRIERTGTPLDIALGGDGFLRVRADQGILYTRAGNLKLSNDRTLLTQEGLPVLGTDGQPIQFPEKDKPFDVKIARDGQIFDGEDIVGTLSVAQFGPDVTLQKVDNGYFKPLDGQEQLLPKDQCQIEQGALEASNFNIVEEMTQMIENTRMFEAYQKILKTCDQADSQLIRSLGNL